jgi:dolichol-phosphate mannosyltransferase
MELTVVDAIAPLTFVLLLVQLPAALILLSRLLQAPRRHRPLQPRSSRLEWLARVSVVVPTLNEAHRVVACLDGLSRQGYEVREILVVDSHSRDGTPELVKAKGQNDPRIRLTNDDPLPPDWVGRPWALHAGFLATSPESDWILGIDADTYPQPGLVASLLDVAQTEGYDALSLSPQFVLHRAGEWWLQPALLMTLIYRFGASGTDSGDPSRVMANGQCFLCRRSVLAQMGGYSSARRSFCDDVTLARNLAAAGFKVGFLDGAKVLKVRMYEGAIETWREWGRSLDLKDAASKLQVWSDLWLLLSVQGLPLFVVAIYLVNPHLWGAGWLHQGLLGLNGSLVAIRIALLWAISPSYQGSHPLFWLSPLADAIAVLRIFLSSWRVPRQWRGRIYSPHRG